MKRSIIQCLMIALFALPAWSQVADLVGGNVTAAIPIFVTGSVRDVKMYKKALRAWTEGASACIQFTDYPQKATYRLNVKWNQRYTLFVHSGNEATMELYNSKQELIWKQAKGAWSVGAYHEGHPEKAMYPELYKALGCGQPTLPPKPGQTALPASGQPVTDRVVPSEQQPPAP